MSNGKSRHILEAKSPSQQCKRSSGTFLYDRFVILDLYVFSKVSFLVTGVSMVSLSAIQSSSVR